jgi:hypothetical protein
MWLIQLFPGSAFISSAVNAGAGVIAVRAAPDFETWEPTTATTSRQKTTPRKPNLRIKYSS